MRSEIIQALTALSIVTCALLATAITTGPNAPVTGRSMIFIIGAGGLGLAIAKIAASYWR